MPIASLRHYFPTVGELRQAAMTHSIRAELVMLEELAEIHDDPWVQLVEFIRHSLGVDAGARRRSWLLWLEYWRMTAREPDGGTLAAEIYGAWDTVMARIIERGVTAGTFTLDMPVSEAAFHIGAFIDGVGPIIAGAADDEAVVARAFHLVESASRRLLSVAPEHGGHLG